MSIVPLAFPPLPFRIDGWNTEDAPMGEDSDSGLVVPLWQWTSVRGESFWLILLIARLNE